jgi:hypothetical protein
VAPGQDTERAILGNHSASAMYDRFVSTLGWEIDLRNHGGYRGRLDCKENYHTAIYYANSTIEMLFHDATRLPTSSNDPQQVNKVCYLLKLISINQLINGLFTRNDILVMITYILYGMNIDVTTDLILLEETLVIYKL